MSGETYTLDVTFTAAVSRVAAGTPLPAGGGEAGKALKALDLAIGTRNWAGIKAGLSPSQLPSFDKDYNSPTENLDNAVDILHAWLPKTGLKITGGEMRGDAAILEVEGEMFPGTQALYLARMVKTGAAWQLDRATLAGMLP